MRYLVVTTFFAFFLNFSYSQKFDKDFMDERLKAIDTSYKVKSTTVYIINGVPYEGNDSLKINAVLQRNGLKYLLRIDKLKCPSSIFDCNNDVVVVVFAYKQKTKEKRELFQIIKHQFTDVYNSFSNPILTNSKDPVLYIDNELVHHYEAKLRINKLKLKNIYYINLSLEPESEEHYGQNAKNGLVRI